MKKTNVTIQTEDDGDEVIIYISLQNGNTVIITPANDIYGDLMELIS